MRAWDTATRLTAATGGQRPHAVGSYIMLPLSLPSMPRSES